MSRYERDSSELERNNGGWGRERLDSSASMHLNNKIDVGAGDGRAIFTFIKPLI
jgi:hypothetical protein